MKLRLILTSALLAPIAFALAAHAQPPQHADDPHGGPPMAEMRAMHDAMMKQHMEDMRIILRLRPDQEPALAAFLAAHQRGMMEMHGPGGAGMMKGPPKAMTTPERLDEMARHESAMSAERDRQRQALAKFYAALSPEQQKGFDALQRLQQGGHGGPGRDGGPRMKRIIVHGGPGGPDGPMPMHDGPH